MISKEIYKVVANRINGWENLKKNDLFDGYIKNEENKFLKEGYFAALMCKYWDVIRSYYYKSKDSGSISIEDCHAWLTHALMYCLKSRVWLKEGVKLNNGAETSMNVCIATTRKIFYQSSNYDNRRSNYGGASFDALLEKNSSAIDYAESIDSHDNWIKDMILEALEDKKYFTAIVMDNIINSDCFKSIKENVENDENKKVKVTREFFSLVRLKKALRNLDNNYCKFFETEYGINYDSMKKMTTKLSTCSQYKLTKAVDREFKNIKEYIARYLGRSYVDNYSQEGNICL